MVAFRVFSFFASVGGGWAARKRLWLKTGGQQLAGQPFAPGKAVVVSEEGPIHWQQRYHKLDFGRHVCWLCHPFAAKPRPDEWLALIDRLAALRDEHDLTPAVLDPLSYFLPSRGP